MKLGHQAPSGPLITVLPIFLEQRRNQQTATGESLRGKRTYSCHARLRSVVAGAGAPASDALIQQRGSVFDKTIFERYCRRCAEKLQLDVLKSASHHVHSFNCPSTFAFCVIAKRVQWSGRPVSHPNSRHRAQCTLRQSVSRHSTTDGPSIHRQI